MKTVYYRHGLFVVALTACITLAHTSSFARKESLKIVRTPDRASASPSLSTRGPIAVDQVLAQWDFENPPGQGWTVVDGTVQPGNFTHVDDFSGLGAPYAALFGLKSLWCGLRPGDCAYATLPGYGNNWDQRFVSAAFPSSGGDVFVDFYIRYDCEPGYDYVKLEYQSGVGPWTTAVQFNGSGFTGYTALIPDGDIGATFRLRFRFTSDFLASDLDGFFNSSGAYELDDIVVRDGGGTINVQHFEVEAVNAQTTLDGKWSAQVSPVYGVHAAVFDGGGVLQEDPGVTNTTKLWGFFDNSPYNYACGGHPEQLVVPYSKTVDGDQLYFQNEIWSPVVDITQDINGFPVAGTISMAADIYRDLTQDAIVFYQYRVRSYVSGCWGRWRDNGTTYYNPSKTWARHTIALSPQIDAGATQVQVAVVVLDACPVWCGFIGSGDCHSHGPLIDNVAVTALVTPSVTNTNDSGAGSLRQAIINANSNADFSYIAFDIPGAGPHVITPASVLPTITTRVAIDGFTQPGSSPNTNGQWQADNAVIKIVLDGNGTILNGLVLQSPSQCTVRGLAIKNFTGNGIYVQGSNNTIKGCYIGLDADGTTAGPVQLGIQVAGSTTIGGDLPADRNVISSCTNTAIWLAAPGCTVKNNFLGTDRTGTLDLGNVTGIQLNSWLNTITGNLISGNAVAVQFGAIDPSGTQILGNRIGTDVGGTSGVGNSFAGIDATQFGDGFGMVTVGSAASPNLIAFNGGAGLRVGVFFGTPPILLIDHNEIHSNSKGVTLMFGGASDPYATLTGNSIHDNTGLGIDLADDGVTFNDSGDLDSGPNDLQNFPTVTSVGNLSGGGVSVNGSLSSRPNRSYAIEYFASPACDGAGYGEGQLYFGRLSGTSSGAGILNFTFDAPAGIPGGWYVTTTATDLTAGATSEFSTCVEYINTPLGTPVVVVPVDPVTLQSPVTLTYSNVTGAGSTSIATGTTGPPPGSWSFGDNPTFYNLTTTATYTGSIEVCIHYDETDFGVPELVLRVLHYDGASWVDVTTSLDTNANILCGTSASLSPFAIAYATGTTDVGDKTPPGFALHPCVPNPFNPSTMIRYDVPTNGAHVSIVIFDVAGRRVRTLIDGAQPAGTQATAWDGRDQRGQSVASGVYFYRMQAGSFTQTRKMVLLK